MIKKQGALLLALLYTITVAGFALNLHYCGSHVADVQINAPAKSCTTPMAKSKMNCCKDSKLDVKVKDDHQKESTSFFPGCLPLNYRSSRSLISCYRHSNLY
jgi:hypothetical protein